MENQKSQSGISLKKREANQRNGQKSNGPKTPEGKARSRRNALKHGILASALLITQGGGAEDAAEFYELLSGLHRDLAPVGTLEEMLVEKIAVCWWRQKRALRCEAGMIRRAFVPIPQPPPLPNEDELVRLFGQQIIHKPNSELAPIKDHLSLPLGADLDRILRYETTIQRQLVYAINQLERLQRARRGEHIPAPLSVQLLSDN
jgi:hypothetical protein